MKLRPLKMPHCNCAFSALLDLRVESRVQKSRTFSIESFAQQTNAAFANALLSLAASRLPRTRSRRRRIPAAPLRRSRSPSAHNSTTAHTAIADAFRCAFCSCRCLDALNAARDRTANCPQQATLDRFNCFFARQTNWRDVKLALSNTLCYTPYKTHSHNRRPTRLSSWLCKFLHCTNARPFLCTTSTQTSLSNPSKLYNSDSPSQCLVFCQTCIAFFIG